MRYRTITLLVLVAIALAMFLFPRFSSLAAFNALQRRRPNTGQRKSAPPAATTPKRSPSRFDHYQPAEHRQEMKKCDSCHDVPTPSKWPQARENKRDYPDVVDYPDHDSCLRCHAHRKDFFQGDRPQICAACHESNYSPRTGRRLEFPNHSATFESEFTTNFPHDKHENIIASNLPSRPTTADNIFRRASFNPLGLADENKADLKFANCAICHQTNTDPSQVRIAKPPPPPNKSYVERPFEAFFKTIPMNHASCFTCHYRNQEPTREQCNGCHVTRTQYPALVWSKRISPKFNHEGGGKAEAGKSPAHVVDCMLCHLNITRVSTLQGITRDGLSPDVPIVTCAACHDSDTFPEVRISKELSERKKKPTFECTICHTSELGTDCVPDSHYIAVGQKAPPKPAERPCKYQEKK